MLDPLNLYQENDYFYAVCYEVNCSELKTRKIWNGQQKFISVSFPSFSYERHSCSIFGVEAHSAQGEI